MNIEARQELALRDDLDREVEILRAIAARNGIDLGRVSVRQRKVAEMLDVSLRTVESLCASGDLEMSDIAGAPRVLLVSVLRYVEKRKRKPKAKPDPPATPKSRAAALIDARRGRRR